MSGPDPKRKKARTLAKEARDDLEERMNMPVHPEALREKLDPDPSKSPELSAGDLDAAWEDADVAGEETVGGSSPTPDQDVVDELGKAAGLTYNDDEPLNSEEKLLRRDRQRWELNPASARDSEDDSTMDEDALPESQEDEDER